MEEREGDRDRGKEEQRRWKRELVRESDGHQ
jgi:hypothetical protein